MEDLDLIKGLTCEEFAFKMFWIDYDSRCVHIKTRETKARYLIYFLRNYVRPNDVVFEIRSKYEYDYQTGNFSYINTDEEKILITTNKIV